MKMDVQVLVVVSKISKKLKLNNFVCVIGCKPLEECEPTQTHQEILPIGMEEFVNNSGCCPRVEIICNPKTCPSPPKCKEHYELISREGECCPIYYCGKLIIIKSNLN